ncbi:hypothetical protein [Caldiplasma sukawensis]
MDDIQEIIRLIKDKTAPVDLTVLGKFIKKKHGEDYFSYIIKTFFSNGLNDKNIAMYITYPDVDKEIMNWTPSKWTNSTVYTLSKFLDDLSVLKTQTVEDNILWQVDLDNYVFTPNKDMARRLLSFWYIYSKAPTEVIMATKNSDGFSFATYAASIDNEASFYRDIVLYIILNQIAPDKAKAFGEYVSFRISEPFEGLEPKLEPDQFKNMKDIIDTLTKQGYKVI